MTDDGSASPAAVLRSLVARAVDADPATLAGRVEVVERGSESAGDGAAGSDAATPAGRLAELVGAADSVVAVVPRFDADLARRLNATLAGDDPADEESDAELDADEESDAEPDPNAPREVRVVFTDSAADRLSRPTGPVVRRALADRGVDAYRHAGESPVALALADDRAVVGLTDEGGVAALLWTDDPAVREWAAATCRRYLEGAESVGDG
ncbi:hypothetical protein SAMN04488067_10560 [Halorubrum xinjiangense]|uniref:Methanogenesis regulatory protein FilR1 middle domain-containing protein n=1 Tax=Halorubrum xinjiangense TaxID=261291 RepID=A0A1G7LPK5_9EURY|nr:hypothetical protein [Halorubrum xinjiangense]SDF51306.1 hypothetical protein SAMN04488067_10560 [Halorubrum xinjiangense]